MRDYFALLNQPRAPWLDLEQLKQAFHARTLHLHPDAQPGSGDTAFIEINEAYQVLRDPKRRLQHLLGLQGHSPSTQGATIPREIEGLFGLVATLTQEANRLIEKLAQSGSKLTRSLERSKTMEVTKQLQETRSEMSRLQDDALVRLKRADAGDTAELQQLYLMFSYLNRWIAELAEKQLHLTTIELSS